MGYLDERQSDGNTGRDHLHLAIFFGVFPIVGTIVALVAIGLHWQVLVTGAAITLMSVAIGFSEGP